MAISSMTFFCRKMINNFFSSADIPQVHKQIITDKTITCFIPVDNEFYENFKSRRKEDDFFDLLADDDEMKIFIFFHTNGFDIEKIFFADSGDCYGVVFKIDSDFFKEIKL